MNDSNNSVEKAVADYLGSEEIDWDKLKPVLCFVVLWNRLEARRGRHLGLRELSSICRQAIKTKNFDISRYEEVVGYFRKRYAEHPNKLDRLFRNGSNSREKDTERILRRLLNNEELNLQESFEAIVFIPYRIRNNLFHGNKSTYKLYKQTSLFENVNNILCLLHSDLR